MRSPPWRRRPEDRRGWQMRVLTVIGNRPQFVKAAAVSRHLRSRATETLVHSGQHYDRELSAVFFEELGLPRPDHELAVGSGTHARQTGTTMSRLEPLVVAERPDAVLAYGDTNTTLATALVAAKLAIPLVHVEAGMRSFNRAMPEEVNRVVADRLAGLLLCSTEAAMDNLNAAGLGDRARLVGDVMADVALELGPLAERGSDVLDRLGMAPGAYLVATLHRAENVDDPEALRRAAELLAAVADRYGPLVFPAHPRTRARLVEGGLMPSLKRDGNIVLSEPLGYLDFTCLVRGAMGVLTDSGGLQKEAYLAAVPCLTLREETEWVETLDRGWNRLVGLDAESAVRGLGEQIERLRDRSPDATIYGDGRAGERCACEVIAWMDAIAAS
jgi:UDP-GlcNAc3NAcA epimerase